MPNQRMHPTGFASLRSARQRVTREPLGYQECRTVSISVVDFISMGTK